MDREGIPRVRITHIDSGQAITLDPTAAENLMLNLGVALDHFRDQDAFLAAAAAGTVLGGGGLLINNEHGSVWLAYGAEGEIIPPP